MDEDELRRKWAELTGQDPSLSEADPTATYRMPPPGSEPGSAPEKPWDTLISRDLSASGEVDGHSPTLHTPPPIPASAGSTPPSDSAIGPTSAGPTSFELREVIGRGGMGIVFRALQTSLQREVAVKKLHQNLGSSSHESRFVAEAMVAGLLDHPNVVPVHELGRTGRGELLIAMKLARGPSWKRLLSPTTDEERARAKSMDRRAHLEVLLAVCNAIAYAHTKGVAHLDLKPENVLVGEFGEVLVMDWGLAVGLDPALVRPGLPHHSAVSAPCGTPAYMPPELAEGDGARIGAWTDTYLLGATLHELVTGKPPHKGKNVADTVLAAIRAIEPPEYGPDVPAELRAILRRALQPRPADRFQSATELRDALAEHLRHAESARVADEARRALEATRVDPALGADDEQARASRYASFADAVAGFRHARVLWAGNDDARRGEAEARRAYATAALAAGDLGLAATQASALRGLAPGAGEVAEADDLAARVHAATEARASAARAAKRARAGLGVALTTIVVGLAAGLALLDRSRRHAEREGARAREQEELALDRAAEANAARAEMERRLADSLLAEGRALGAAGRWDAGRARLSQARALLLEQRRPVLPVELTLLQSWHEAPEALLAVPGSGSGSQASVSAVALAKEADVVVTGTTTGWLRVVERRSGRVRHDLAAHTGAVLALDVSLDGRRAVSGGADGLVRAWDLTAGRELATLAGHGAPVRAVALARHAEVVASGGDDGSLRAWDLATKAETARIAHSAPVVAVALSWNGVVAATGSGRTVRVVHVGAASTLETHDAHEGAVTCVALGGDYVLSGGTDHRVISSSIRGVGRTTLVGHTGAVRRVTFDEDDDHALSAADDGTLRRWEIAHKDTQAREVGRRAVPLFSVVALDPELARVATGHHDGALRVHDLTHGLPGGREALDLAGPPSRAVGVDPTGQIVVAATEGGAARVWDAASGRPLAQLAGHASAIVAIDVVRPSAADGPHGLTVSADGRLILWDLVRGLPLKTLELESLPRCARLTPDATRVVTGTNDGLVRLTSWADGAEAARLDGHTGPVNAVALGSARVASGGEDGTVRVGATAGPLGEAVLVGRHDAPLSCVAISKDDRLVVSGASDGTLRAWDAGESSGRSRWEVLAHAGPVVGVAIVTDAAGGQVVVSAGADGALIVRDPVTGADLAALPSAGLVHAFAASPDGLRLVLGGPDGARLWDASRVARRDVLRAGLAAPLLSLRGAWAAFVGAREDAALLLHAARDSGQEPPADDVLLATQWGRGHLVDAADAAERLIAAGPSDPLADVRLEAVRLEAGEVGARVAQELDIFRSLAFTRDGGRLITTSRDADLTVWHARAGVALRRMRHGTARDLGALELIDDRRAATGAADGTIMVWDLDTGDRLATFSSGDEQLSDLLALPDGRLLAGGHDGAVREWSLVEPARPARLVTDLGERDGVRALALSPDGRRLAVAGREPTVRLFAFPAGTPLGALDGPTTTIDALEFLADGRLLATSGSTLFCWAAEPTIGDGLPLRGHESSIYGFAIAPDGRRAATAGSDGLRLWDLSRGNELRFVPLPDAIALALAWSPDGKVIAIGLRDGEVRLLLAPP